MSGLPDLKLEQLESSLEDCKYFNHYYNCIYLITSKNEFYKIRIIKRFNIFKFRREIKYLIRINEELNQEEVIKRINKLNSKTL